MPKSKMPRTNKDLRSKWTEEKMIKALEAVGSGIAVHRASIIYNVPRRTLRRYLK